MEQRQFSAGQRPAAKAKPRLMAVAAAAALMLSASCGSTDERGKYWNMADGWPYSDTLVCQVDTTARADVAVVVRHAANYEFSNLWLELTISRPNEEDVADTFNVVLADDFGRWRGHGIGVGMQYADTLLHSIGIQDSTRLSLRHIMRADTLAGIEQVGIVLNFK
ncbi:MAG: gliding motility lipoprotein GldH [Clostridium sp.]|nr:gliding motility lipoprotein GldH [Clostridium sp.]